MLLLFDTINMQTDDKTISDEVDPTDLTYIIIYVLKYTLTS